MKRILSAIGRLIVGLLFLALLGFVCVWIGEWTPAPEETVYAGDGAAAILPDTLTVLTWNMGYAGLHAFGRRGKRSAFFAAAGRPERLSRLFL